MLLNERGAYAAPTQCFEAEGPRTGKQIDCMFARAFSADEIKNGLADPVLHGPGDRVAPLLKDFVAEFAAAQRPADNSQLGDIRQFAAFGFCLGHLLVVTKKGQAGMITSTTRFFVSSRVSFE